MDGWNPAKMGATGTSNFDVWATFTSGGSLITRQIQGDGIDQHLAYVTSSNAYWYLTDHLDSTRATINNSGTVQDSIVYDAYGNITSQSNASAAPLYTYTGRELDVETGLQYNRARWYDPGTGRWISQDPMGFGAGDSNLYRYVNNRPTSATDPSGLTEITTTFTWLYYCYRGDNYVLSQLTVVGDFEVGKDNTVNVTKVPQIPDNGNKTYYGTCGMIANPTFVRNTYKNGSTGLVVSFAVSSNLTKDGFLTTVATHASVGFGIGTIGTIAFGAGPAVGTGIGVVTGTTSHLFDFSSWNSTMTMNYELYVNKAGRLCETADTCSIPSPGNRLVACIASNTFLKENGTKPLYVWSRNMLRYDAARGMKVWLTSDIAPKYGLQDGFAVKDTNTSWYR